VADRLARQDGQLDGKGGDMKASDIVFGAVGTIAWFALAMWLHEILT
jgi:hypothetical protein